ncbi:hypothetical protein ABFX02_03G046000 [Erythranthe guttata]
MEIEHQIIVRGEEEQQTKQQVQLINPPSPSSSPSHEFSFTISLHPPPQPPPPQPPSDINTNKPKSPPPIAAIDLSPADEIFFHGHLLPLHILSGGGGRHLPAAGGFSPRTSTNSLDSFTLPIKELPDKDDDDDDDRRICNSSHVLEGKDRGKSKSFSLIFGLPRKPRKGSDDDEGQKRKSSRFELVKRLVKPFLSLRKGNQEFPPPAAAAPPPPPYNSYSGNLRVRNKREFMRGRRRGEFSAPASMRNSPTNSGRNLVAASGGSGTVTPTKSDSTMEELQAAIQAAIAHCKKSVHAPEEEEEEDRIKLQP